MALSFTLVKDLIAPKYAGGVSIKLVDITLDNSYPGGGWPVTPGNLFLGSDVIAVLPQGGSGRVFEWDDANGKLLARETGAAVNGVLAEIGATEANGQVVRALVIGR